MMQCVATGRSPGPAVELGVQAAHDARGARRSLAARILVGLALLSLPLTLASSAGGETLGLVKDLSNHYLLRRSQGYLGVDVEPVSPTSESGLKLKNADGAEIVAVDHDAPAGQAGLRTRDVILDLNGKPVGSASRLRRKLREMPPGRFISLVVSRDGALLNMNVQLCDRSKLQQQAWSRHYSVPAPDSGGSAVSSILKGTRTSSFLGGSVSSSPEVGAYVYPVSAQLAGYFGVSSGVGLLVDSVENQSPASRAGLKAGDVILKVDAVQMASLSGWLKVMRSRRGKRVQLTVVRNRQQQILTMFVGDSKNDGKAQSMLLEIAAGPGTA